ncbi:MAG: ABC transporter permease subunit [Oscillospiraceae bacterium]
MTELKQGVKNKRLSVFAKRNRNFTLIILVIGALFVLASKITQYELSSGMRSVPNAFGWLAHNFIPDQKAWDRLPNILEKLTETILLSIAVTVVSGVLAFFFSLLGSRTTKINGIVARLVRIIAAFFRNVPDVVWAILLMFSFGQNVLTGFFALFFATFGMLTRTFIETIDEVSGDCVEALDASGASLLQIVFQGIMPSSLSELLTWVLFMIETNIRTSTLIGMLTGRGIGYLFNLYYKRLDYASASLVVLSIVVVVIAIELISTNIRKVIM